MQLDQLLSSMTPEVYTALCQAVETGKWANGEKLSDEQKANALQAVMLYQSQIEKSDQHMTIGEDGEIVHKSRVQLQQELKQKQIQETTIAKFKTNDI